MSYREFPPPPALASVIECVWTSVPEQRAEASPRPENSAAHSILPDGAMDVIAAFHPDGDIAETFAVGAMTRPQFATVGNRSMVGIRFLPGTGGSALGVNANTLTDQQCDIRDVLRHRDTLRDAFRDLHFDASNAHALHLFASALRLHDRAVPPLVRDAARRIGAVTMPLKIEHLANELGVSRQHLTRIFSQHAGLTPKLFAQICRVRALLAAVQQRMSQTRGHTPRFAVAGPSWSTLAAEFGYTDQSHLIAEVGAVIGQTPGAWHANGSSNFPIAPVPVAAL